MLNYIVQQQIELLQSEIAAELKSYKNLPLHLAALYLSIDPNHEMYVFDFKVRAYKKGMDNAKTGILLDLYDPDGESIGDIIGLNSILLDLTRTAGRGSGMSYTSYRYNKKFYKNIAKIYGKTTKASINTKLCFSPEGVGLQHNYVYSKNIKLVNSFKSLLDLYENIYGYVPIGLRIPALYFFKNSALVQIFNKNSPELEGFPDSQKEMIMQYPLVLRYDVVQHSIKSGLTDSPKLKVIKPSDLLDVYTEYQPYRAPSYQATKVRDYKYKLILSDKDQHLLSR